MKSEYVCVGLGRIGIFLTGKPHRALVGAWVVAWWDILYDPFTDHM